MTAQIFDNAMTAHVWAQQRQPSGRSHNGNFYFEGTRIYSYGGHYVAGLALPGGLFAVNGSGYSMTTNGKHLPAVRRAVAYTYFSFPDLTEIADSVETLAKYKAGERTTSPAEHHAKRLESYLAKHWRELSDDSAAYLLGLYSGRRWEAEKGRYSSAASKSAERSAKACARLDRKAASDLARVPLRLVRERSWRQADSYGQRQLRETCKDWSAAHKAAGGKRIKAAVWTRLKLARSIVKRAERMADRHGNNGKITGVRAQISNLRRLAWQDFSHAGESISALEAVQLIPALTVAMESSVYILRNASGMPPAIRARLQGLADYATAAVRYLEGEQAARARKAREHSDLRHTLRTIHGYAKAVAAGELGQRSAWFLRYAGAIAALRDSGRFAAMGAKLAALLPEIEQGARDAETAEERAAEAARAAKAAWRDLGAEGRRDAWRAGTATLALDYGDTTESGPLLRANGAELDGCRITAGELETSEGARVPLRHAFAVFAFVRDCRAKGLPWLPADAAGARGSHARHGPAHIRVGHFQVDSIAATGDFKAGCHSIKWAEVERLANALGVFDCAPLPMEGEAA